ncbi:MAG TPA: fructose-6-phosphate aldolase [Abditibacterium sp.]|jgi:transaldolase
MKFFLDTADIKEIREAQETGLLDGVTTNPSHVAKSGRNFIELVKEICEIVPGPVSAEVTAEGKDDMLRQGRFLADLASNIVVKVPLTQEGLKAVKVFTEEGIKTNVTLCFSPVQALLAAKVGATYISPFVGRLDDIAIEGLDGIRKIREIYDNYGFGTQILTASTRSALHIQDAAIAGSDVATMPMALFKKLVNNPLTDIGLKMFETDWNKIPEEFRTY